MSPQPTSVDGIEHALSGDRTAVRALVDALTPVVQARVARVLLRRAAESRGRTIRQEVEDLTQDVFVALFEADGAILRGWSADRGLSLANYVGLVAERRTLNVLASRRRSPWTEDPTAPADLPSAASTPTGARRYEERALLAAVLDRLRAELSPKGLEVFTLMMVEQLETDALCARTGMNANALYAWRSRLIRRAREIRAALLAEAPEGGR